MSEVSIVVAGAGFGGVRAALDLAKNLPSAKITLINNNPYHCFNPNLYELAAIKLQHEGKLEFQNLQGAFSIPLELIFQNSQVEVIIQKISQIDLEQKQVWIGTHQLKFDFLVLSLGSKTNYFGVPGAKDFSHPFKTAEDALNIHNDLEERVSMGQLPKVVIAGGGFTGVEIAGQLKEFLPKDSTVTI